MKGNPYDNAMAENFFSILKTECIYRHKPATFSEANEMIGLTWDAIDWKKRTLTVNKTLEYRHKQGHWRAGPPKTVSSYRTIPLTERAYDILKAVHATRAIERGMPPKTLQKLLGHASIKTTMDRYVHVTEESLVAGVRQFEQGDPANTQLEQTSAGDNTKKSDSAA